MQRSIDTARKIFNKSELIIDDRLNEMDYGLAEGFQYKELCFKYPNIIEKWKNHEDPRFPNGENTNDVYIRLSSFLSHLNNEIKIKKRKRICIITHNVVLRCLLGSFYNINSKYWHKLNIPHGVPLEFNNKNESYYPNIDRSILYNIQKQVHKF